LPFDDVHIPLDDIRRCIENIELFLEDLEFESYQADIKTKSAVERQLQIISEAAGRLRDHGERLCPEIDWRALRSMGNVLRHAYHRVEDRIIWDTAKLDLPPLKACVERVLSRDGDTLSE
jgi:uncharacterized protein with HEPN domain